MSTLKTVITACRQPNLLRKTPVLFLLIGWLILARWQPLYADWEVPILIDANTIPTSLVLGDLNGDGALDLVTNSRDHPSLAYLNDRQGRFSNGIPLPGLTNATVV